MIIKESFNQKYGDFSFMTLDIQRSVHFNLYSISTYVCLINLLPHLQKCNAN